MAGSRIVVVKTTRPEGGWQMYFNQSGPPVGCPKVHQLGPDVDIKGAGGTVVAPGGTITGRSGTYALIQGDLADLPDCPRWLPGLQRPKGSASSRYSQPRARWITPGRIKAASVLDEERRKIEGALDGQQNTIINEAAWRLFQLPAAGHRGRADRAGAGGGTRQPPVPTGQGHDQQRARAHLEQREVPGQALNRR